MLFASLCLAVPAAGGMETAAKQAYIVDLQTGAVLLDIDKLHAVIGGFHLTTAKPDYIEHTVDELERLAPDVVVPMHCTGAAFIEAMRRRMPERLVASSLGSRFTFCLEKALTPSAHASREIQRPR